MVGIVDLDQHELCGWHWDVEVTQVHHDTLRDKCWSENRVKGSDTKNARSDSDQESVWVSATEEKTRRISSCSCGLAQHLGPWAFYKVNNFWCTWGLQQLGVTGVSGNLPWEADPHQPGITYVGILVFWWGWASITGPVISSGKASRRLQQDWAQSPNCQLSGNLLSQPCHQIVVSVALEEDAYLLHKQRNYCNSL